MPTKQESTKWADGTRVRVISVMSHGAPAGSLGTIVGDDVENGSYAVEFDDYTGGHSCGGLGECGCCQWVGEEELERVELVVLDATSKPTNPKDALATDKIPFHLWPETATILGTLGLLDGALKYGRSNWRAVGVKASIYHDALRRHANALFEGEDIDPDSGLPHEAHLLATAAIMIDAKAAGKWNDDRMYPGGYRSLIDEMTPHVKRLKEKHTGKTPKHYTIADGGLDEG